MATSLSQASTRCFFIVMLSLEFIFVGPSRRDDLISLFYIFIYL